jgi:hypothetical protein
VSNPGSTVIPCAFGGVHQRRQLTLAPGAAAWEQAGAITMEKDLDEVKAQGALVADSIKAMNETLHNLLGWMPQVDTSITTIQKLIDEVTSHVIALEAMRSPDEDQTPRPDGHRLRNNIQGPDSDAIRAPFHALVKGTKKFQHSAVQFEIGDHSGKDRNSPFDDSGYTNHTTHRDRNYSRMHA